MLKINLGGSFDELKGAQNFVVEGLSDPDLEKLKTLNLTQQEWQTLFPIYVGHIELSIKRAPVAGTYSIQESSVIFLPHYPLLPGQYYQAIFDFSKIVSAPYNTKNIPRFAISFQIPKRQSLPTTVTQVYPSADILPENLLRFYIYFSSPMREGVALNHIHLMDDKGDFLENVFLDTVEELWDPTMTCLTVFLDPARVKTGLTMHNQLGRALVAGNSYCLVIDKDWHDVNGASLLSPFEKKFSISKAKTAPPNINDWAIISPTVKTKLPISIKFTSSFDRILLMTCIKVLKPNGELCIGRIDITHHETQWHFIPKEEWEVGSYKLEISSKLEDITGNNLQSPFEKRSDPNKQQVKNYHLSLLLEPDPVISN